MSKRSPIKSGSLNYTSRAYRQDADQAMRGDPVRALIELVTNADDAYYELKMDGGEIHIEVRPTGDANLPLELLVRDQASGLTGGELEHHFTQLGVKKKRGSRSRGLFGRGAKDTAALGRLVVETVKEGRYSRIDLTDEGAFELMASGDDLTEVDLEPSGLTHGSGLAARLFLRSGNLVSAKKLSAQLSRHAQLRDLVARRVVILRDTRPKAGEVKLRLEPPAVPGAIVLDQLVDVPGYQPIRLKVRRFDLPDASSVDTWSDQGLLVRSDRTIFENTWLELDRARPAAAHFGGELDTHEASDLIHQFDLNGPTASNPTRLLRRDREGLAPEHPYRKALQTAVLGALLPLFEEVERDRAASGSQGVHLKKDLREAARALRSEVAKILEEIEEELGGDSGAGDALPPLAVIPPKRIVRTGEKVTLSLRASLRPGSPGVAVVEDESAEGVVLSAACSSEQWERHPNLEAFTSKLYVDAGDSEGTAVIRVLAGDLQASALIVVDNTADPEATPTSLAFEPDVANVSPNRGRRLRLRAPMSFDGVVVSVSRSGDDIVSLAASEVRLRPVAEGDWCEARVCVEAGPVLGGCEIIADRGEAVATCRLTVRRPVEPEGFELDFMLVEGSRPQRAVLRREGAALKVELFADHPSYNKVFGRLDQATNRFPEEDSPGARAVIAEVIADELASYLTEIDFTKRPERYTDASRILRQRAQYGLRLLPIAHRMLRPGA